MAILEVGSIAAVRLESISFHAPDVRSSPNRNTEMTRSDPKLIESHVRVVLQSVSGPMPGIDSRRFVTNPEGFAIGRSLTCDWAIPEDGLLSRQHVRLIPTRSGCTLTDLGSTNGTNLNDEPVEAFQAVELLSGDVVQCGRCCFRVDFEIPETSVVQASESLTDEGPSAASIDLDLAKGVPLQSSSPSAPAASPDLSMQPPIGRTCSLCRKSVSVDATSASASGEVHFGPGSTSDSKVWVCPDCRRSSTDKLSEEELAPHFETIRLLGRGAMGVVYLARHRVTGRDVALKIIDPESAASRTAIERFLREMSVIGTLKHPNIVECLDQGHDHGRLWFAMEYVSGVSVETLAQANRGTYPCHQACRLVCQVLRGLEHAHSQGFVHRDIKPENILIGRTPENKLIAKISDFGLAKNYQQMGGSGLTFSGEMRGTIPFMPPEQMIDFKTVQPSADLYATAATLYYLMSGTYVFESDSDTDDMIQMLLDHRIVPLARRRHDVPVGLSDLLDRCLARKPEDRFPTASAMRTALKAFA